MLGRWCRIAKGSYTVEDLKKEKAARRGKKVSREIVNHLESIVGSDVSEGNVSRTTAVKALAEQMQVSFTSLKRVLENDRQRVFAKTHDRMVDWYEKDIEAVTPIDVSPHDMANRPAHYTDSGIECIDAMVAVFGEQRVREYAEISAFKYKWRAGKKGNEADALLDKAKDIWYTRYSMGDDPRK